MAGTYVSLGCYWQLMGVGLWLIARAGDWRRKPVAGRAVTAERLGWWLSGWAGDRGRRLTARAALSQQLAPGMDCSGAASLTLRYVFSDHLPVRLLLQLLSRLAGV